MNDKFAKLRGLIAKSLNASPKSWRSFFKKYRIATFPSRPEKTIVMLYRQYGDSVLTDVNQILATGDMDQFLGIDKEKAGDVFDDAIDIIKIFSNSNDDDSTQEPNDSNDSTDSDEAKEAKRTKVVIGVFIGLCVLSILTFVLVKKLK